ncbi:MAG: OmpH family outer membrane protein [Alphaproteobacteria bacterium]|nr:MAG: OmpH family outer membrane protein [Alphaproteobacteria bacterium]
MKLRNLALIAALLVGGANTAGAALAQTKIFVVNEDKVRRDSKVGKEINQTLVSNANAGADQLGLKQLKTEIDAEAQRLKPQTESLTPEALNGNPTLKAQVEALGKKQQEYMQKAGALNNGIERADNGLSQAFVFVLGPAVNQVAKDVNADIVLDANSAWFVKDATDITAKVVARLDATVPNLQALRDAMPKPPAGAAAPANAPKPG